MSTGAIIFTVLLAVFKLLVSCMPNDTVKWITKKFELHPELKIADTKVFYNGAQLSNEDETNMITQFNEAQFLKSKHIFAGNEELFLHPETGVEPIVIDTKQNKKDVRLYVFGYSDSIDVVKQYKKKLYAYTLSSEQIQKQFTQAKDSSREVEVRFEPTA